MKFGLTKICPTRDNSLEEEYEVKCTSSCICLILPIEHVKPIPIISFGADYEVKKFQVSSSLLETKRNSISRVKKLLICHNEKIRKSYEALLASIRSALEVGNIISKPLLHILGSIKRKEICAYSCRKLLINLTAYLRHETYCEIKRLDLCMDLSKVHHKHFTNYIAWACKLPQRSHTYNFRPSWVLSMSTNFITYSSCQFVATSLFSSEKNYDDTWEHLNDTISPWIIEHLIDKRSLNWVKKHI